MVHLPACISRCAVAVYLQDNAFHEKIIFYFIQSAKHRVLFLAGQYSAVYFKNNDFVAQCKERKSKNYQHGKKQFSVYIERHSAVWLVLVCHSTFYALNLIRLQAFFTEFLCNCCVMR